MVLQLLKNTLLSLKMGSCPKKYKERAFEFDFECKFSEEESDTFVLIFYLTIINPDKFKVDIEYASFFQASESINEDFIKSPFPIINAPAIAFPYLRCLLSNFTLNAGFEPVILPSINFVEFAEEKKKRGDEAISGSKS